MAKSQSQKQVMNMVYGIGAAIVILGALFKLMHWPGGNMMLIAGLLTEASIFFISAFERPDKELDWSLVYPQLLQEDEYDEEGEFYEEGEEGVETYDKDPIAEKVEALFRDAKIDKALLDKLAGGIQNLTSTAESMTSSGDALSATKRYTEQVTLAADQINDLNTFYKTQIDHSNMQAAANEQILDVTGKIKSEMEDLSSHLSSLNGVYGNMLTAMKS